MNDERYSRQMRFAGIGEAGQAKLRESRVLVLGAGALGAGNAELLVRAGIGSVTIVDRDYVELSNLQRQHLFADADARERLPKAEAARRRLTAINPDVRVQAHVTDVSAFELERLVEAGIDLIIDATDNFETRMILNDAAHKFKIPWIYGACTGSYGVSYMVVPGETPCLRCLLPDDPQSGATCETSGVIAPAVQMTVAFQSAEALKWLTGNRAALHGKLVTFDVWSNQHSFVRVDAMRKNDCPTCGDRPTLPALAPDGGTKSAVLCGRDTVHIRPPRRIERDLAQLADRLAKLGGGTVESNPFLVSYAIAPYRIVFFRDGRVLVHGTSNIAEARSIYSRFLG